MFLVHRLFLLFLLICKNFEKIYLKLSFVSQILFQLAILFYFPDHPGDSRLLCNLTVQSFPP